MDKKPTILLEEVQTEVAKQLFRDYPGRFTNERLQAICMAGLCEEAGEVAGLFKREFRGLPKDLQRASREHWVEELGDVLWYLTATCTVRGIPLEEIWKYNKRKLEQRYGK